MRGSFASLTALALIGVVAVGTTSCTAGQVPVASSSTPSPSSGDEAIPANPSLDSVVTITDENVQTAIADIPDSVRAATGLTGAPGVAVAVVWDGKIAYAEGFGTRDVDTGEKVDADTVFPLASLSKSVGATVVARAIGEGIVGWDTPVSANLPGFTLSDPWVGSHVTIADMYAHRSGLYDHAGDELEEIGFDRATILQRLGVIPLDPFRAAYHYGNFDITAAAESVAAAAGEDWAELSRRLLYEPLGMTATSSRFADLEATGNRAMGHVVVDEEWVVNPAQRQPDEQSPAGGVSSSANDMAAWMAMVLDGGDLSGEPFIAAEDLLPAISSQIVAAPATELGARSGYYGYGFNVGTTAGGLAQVSHSGAFALGAGTNFQLLPAAGLGIVVLANGQADGTAEGIGSRFMDIAQFGQQRRDWLSLYTDYLAQISQPFGELAGEVPPGDAAPPAEPASYAGTYANDYFGPATVSVVGDTLELSLGPTGRWTLEHWSGDDFVFHPESENAVPGSVSRASFDGDTLVLEYFDQHQLGTFVR